MGKKAKKQHKDQHYVAKCYLKGWLEDAIPAGSTKPAFVWVFDKDGSKCRRESPKKLFTQEDLYTVRGPQGERDLGMEHGLGDFEDRFAKVRDSKFNFRRPLTRIEWEWMWAFIVTAHMRTKSMIDHHIETWRSVYDMVDNLTAQVKADAEAAVQRAYPPSLNDGPKYTPQLGDWEALQESTPTMLLQASIKTVLPVIARMHRTIFCTDDPIGFVTSDTPCIWHDSTAYRRPPVMRGVGVMNREIEITMPLSPRQCILFTHYPVAPPGYVDCSLELVDSLNARQIGYAHESFVSRSPVVRSQWFARQSLPADAWENSPTPDRWANPDSPWDADFNLKQP